MQPDETSDRTTGHGPGTGMNTGAGAGTDDATATEVQAVVETGTTPDDELLDLDGGGDPPCWIGLIDDQRDQQ